MILYMLRFDNRIPSFALYSMLKEIQKRLKARIMKKELPEELLKHMTFDFYSEKNWLVKEFTD